MAREPGKYDPGRQSALNRLNKAAALGFGPLAKAAPPVSTVVATRREPVAVEPAIVRNSERKWKVRPDLRNVQIGEAIEDADIDGFLAPKHPAAHNGGSLAPKQSILQSISISTSTSLRATAASVGAKPKAAAPRAPDELYDAQPREQAEQDFERVQRPARQDEPRRAPPREPAAQDPEREERTTRRGVESEERERSHGGAHRRENPEDEERYQKLKEERRKREEWRKRWREEKKREAERKQQAKQSEDESAESSERERGRGKDKDDRGEDKDNPTVRARLWRTLNNDGRVYNKMGHVDPGLGQVTDRELDRRFQEQESKSSQGKLMTEEEVMARLKSGRLKGGRDSWKHCPAGSVAPLKGGRDRASRSRSREKRQASRQLLGVWVPRGSDR